MQTAFGLLECMEYFLFLKSFHKPHFFCTFLSDFLCSKETAHSPFHVALTAAVQGGTGDWRTQALGRAAFNSQVPFSEFVVLISANVMWPQRDDHCKWLPAPCIEELLFKQVILLIPPNKSGATGRFHQSHQEKKAEEILSGEPEHQGNSMFLRLLLCFSLRQFLKSI